MRFVLHYVRRRKWMIKQINRRQMLFVRHYFYFLSEKTRIRLQVFGQFCGIILLTAIIAFVFLNIFAPLGITIQYTMGQDNNNISTIGPSNRVSTIMLNGQKVTKTNNDLVYFTTDIPFNFDSATVKIWYKNSNPDQTFSVGFQDQENWDYDIKPFDVPFFNTLTWEKSGSNPILYQRKQAYKSAGAFLQNPPKNAIIGTFDIDNTDIGDTSKTRIADYQPSKKNTIITAPLRGKHVIYAYLDQEPFHMIIQKQDLNWYAGADPMTVSIYKGNSLVDQVTEPDDGITVASSKIGNIQKIDIDSSSSGFPQSGVYKIVINADEDTIIKSITTNLHKLVFQGSLFLAGNNQVYPGVNDSSSATTVYTNALSLSAMTYHVAGEQQITVDNQILNLNSTQYPQTITPSNNLSEIIVPKNDVILDGFQGYFAFSRGQFFLPTKYHVLPITSDYDIPLTDYILTDYSPSYKEAGWQVNEQTFDLHSAYINNNNLSWIIEAPQLKERNNTLLIKNIQVTFHKNGWAGV
jgi:hypothetical protein